MLIRTSKRRSRAPRIFTAVMAASFVTGVGLWIVCAPVEKGSAVYWAGSVLIALPVWAAMEPLINLVLGAKWVEAQYSPIRIFFGVAWLVLCALALGLLVLALSPLIAS